MNLTSERRALDKIYRRRDRYDIPDWQREGVWDVPKKQLLIDSVLRGWKLPKFYFQRIADDEYEVIDGQQRLQAIIDFCANDLPLSDKSAREFGASLYKDLPQKVADTFDDFEIEYDVIEDATEAELKEFFLRLQAGLPLTSSERLNAVHSKLRDFCRKTAKHVFLSETIAIPNTRYAHFDIVAKVATAEVEGLNAGLRFEDIKAVFEAQSNFSNNSAAAKRIRAALDLLQEAFRGNGAALRTRTIVQSLITLTCKLVATGRLEGKQATLRAFFETFIKELADQIELGQAATDTDYVTFQHSVNANIKGSAQTRHEILLRKLFLLSPDLADVFDPSVLAESGVSGKIKSLAESIVTLVGQANGKYAASNGEDLFKPTNKTAQALVAIGKVSTGLEAYKELVDNLYFLFRESAGLRLDGKWPPSFVDVNDLRTDLRHDVDHGEPKKIHSKRRKLGQAFAKYAGAGTPDTLAPEKFAFVQANLLSVIEVDLRTIVSGTL
jgi:hypothetical protein